MIVIQKSWNRLEEKKRPKKDNFKDPKLFSSAYGQDRV